jgi:hypothetical protein
MHPKTRGNRVFVAVALAAGLLVPAASVGAEDSPLAGPAAEPTPAATRAPAASTPTAAPENAGESQQDELSRRATDPTASPPSFAGIGEWTTGYRDLADGTPVDEDGFAVRFQTVVPFKAWGVANIFRMTVPYQVSGPAKSGLGDVTIFDLVILPQSWGRLGIGAVASLVQAEKEADGHFAGGPAVGVVVPVSKKLNLGLFNQNLFGDDVSISQIQPIAAYQLGGGWSLSLGDLQWPYDWDRGEFVSMPIGLQLGKVQKVAGQPMRFSVNPQYDMKDLPGASRFTLKFTIQLILPEGKR